ncbi:glutamyl-tRNA(Gln) amidotransferase subunit A-like [Schistocerca gregaria]|uniref:glutamyl-tRNA(Gln) amidotransferase subunit A-like n=1 Tax=Schistocerca gregaria TaxID=7010 RepID=UPI00211DB868|nr:glutamyl-tRNA(Gln) amidotransferase subunit A-like [Schistocerca gregaria]
MLSEGETTSVELVRACMRQMQRTRKMNAYVSKISEELVLEEAEKADRRRSRGEAAGVLSGIPLAVKDNYAVRNTHTTCSSKMLENFVSPYDSTVTARLESAGGIIVGKTNMDEFAMGSMTSTSFFGPTISPWSFAFGGYPDARETGGRLVSPGGSSGGSAVAVCSGTAFAATGTDTGGSVRLPSAWTGLVGFKPSYGACSRFGIVKFASSLDTPGLFSKCVQDARILFDVVSSPDPADSTSVVPSEGRRPKRKIGIPSEFNISELSDEIRELWTSGIRLFENQGYDIVDVSLPHAPYALPCYYIISPAEAFSNLAKYDGVRYGHRATSGDTVFEMYSRSRSEGFGEEVQRRILLGAIALSNRFPGLNLNKAMQIRRLIRDDFKSAFDNVDAILTPTAATPAVFMNDANETDQIHMYLTDAMTVPANMAGIPAISVPMTLSRSGLPMGLQLMAPMFQDRLLLEVAEILEEPWQSNLEENVRALKPVLST